MHVCPTARRGAARAAHALLAVVAAVVAVLLTAGAALADPGTPGETDVEAATVRVQQLTQDLADLAHRIVTAQTVVIAAEQNSAIALDHYQAQQQVVQDAQAQATAAQAAASSAAQALDAAQQELEAFARSSYIDGSTSPGAAALFAFDDPADLVERAVLLGLIGADKADVLAQVTALRQQAAQAAAAAQAALASVAAQQQRATETLTTAQTAERAARRQQAALVTQKSGLLDQVADKQAVLAGLVGPDQAAAIVAQARAAAATPGGGAPRSLGVLVGNRTLAGLGSATAAQKAIAAATASLRTPYAWGGGGAVGPGPGVGLDAGVVGFDCSGLTQYAYARAGLRIPRNSRAQYAALPKVARTDLRPGDLVFWAQDPADPDTIHHVALYLGGGQVIHAPESGDVVTISPMWWDGYAGGVRPSA